LDAPVFNIYLRSLFPRVHGRAGVIVCMVWPISAHVYMDLWVLYNNKI